MKEWTRSEDGMTATCTYDEQARDGSCYMVLVIDELVEEGVCDGVVEGRWFSSSKDVNEYLDNSGWF